MKTRWRVTSFIVCACAAACTAVLGVEGVPNEDAESEAGTDTGRPTSTTEAAPPTSEAGPTDAGSEADASSDAGAPDADDASDAAVDPIMAAFQAFEHAKCMRYQDCQPGFFSSDYANLDECEDAGLGGVSWLVSLPSTMFTVENVTDCANAEANISCADVALGTEPLACAFAGSRDIGANCLADAQCSTGFCDATLTTCGTCSTPPGEGDPCTPNGLCGVNLACVSKSNTCERPQPAGSSCSTADPVCDNTSTCASGECAAYPRDAGAACPGVMCDESQSVTCNAMDGGPPTCIPFTVASQGEACTADETATTRSIVICRRNVGCTRAGTCNFYPIPGEYCNVSDGKGPFCLAPLYCIDHMCTPLPDPATAGCN